MSNRNYTKPTIAKLCGRSGNQCAFPGCDVVLFSGNNTKNIKNICHIEAISENGERYNPTPNDNDRNSYDNLILLCPNHHGQTNDVELYPVEELKRMKETHENEVGQKMMIKNPSLILDAIVALAEIDWDDQNFENIQTSFSIDEKLTYNLIQRWNPIIERYKVHESKIDSVYNQLEQSGESFKKHKLLSVINTIYLRKLGEYQQENPDKTRPEVVKLYADDILDAVEEKLLEQAEGMEDNKFIAMPIIMVDAFMRCKILERPIKS